MNEKEKTQPEASIKYNSTTTKRARFKENLHRNFNTWTKNVYCAPICQKKKQQQNK